MKAVDFASVLHSLSELTSDVAARTSLRELAAVFAIGGKATVAAVCKQLEGLTPESDESGWSRALLARHLVHAQTMFAKAGAKTPASDFTCVIDSLQSANAGGVASWTRGALARLSEKSGKKRSSSKPEPIQPDESALVDGYVSRLATAGWDQAKFDAVVESIRNDRSAKLDAVKRIAEQYAQLRVTARSKPKALDALNDDFVSRLRTKNELEVVGKTKPW